MEDTVNLRFEGSYSSDDEIQVVVFKLGREEYAVDVMSVQEINRLLNITRVPHAASYIEGVLNLRGNIIPVVNLHTRFGLEELGDQEDKRIIVFQWDEIKAGIIVDEVLEVLRLREENIERASCVYNSIEAEHIKGIAKVNERLLIILDVFKIVQT